MKQRIKDWFWWNFVIRKNEFHPRLNLDTKKILSGKVTLEEETRRITMARERAHNLDMYP